MTHQNLGLFGGICLWLAAMLFVVGYLLGSLDLVLWTLMLGPIKILIDALKPKPRVLAIDNAPDAPRRRESGFKDLHATPFPGVVENIWDIMKRSSKEFADRPCCGTRQYLGEGTADPAKGQRFPPKKFGDTSWLTYKETYERMECFGAGLRNFGMEPQPQLKNGETFDDMKGKYMLVVYENTCADWIVAANGAFSQSIVVSTVYATLGADAVKEAVNEGNAYALLCNRANLPQVAKAVAQMPSLKVIIYTDDYVKPEDRLLRPEQIPNIKLVSFEEVVDLGREKKREFPQTVPKPNALAVIMYTSGSTGKPKGVLIQHRQLLGMVAGLYDHFADMKRGEEVFAAFLPLAHILELAAEHAMLLMGGALGYCDPRTLTISGAEPKGALEEYRPTVMAAVPKIWDVIKKGAEAKAKAGGAVKHFLFHWAVQAKCRAQRMGMDTPLFNALVFAPIKKITGGRLRFAISGGGPLDKEVQEFIAATICPLIQGYGLTETCGAGTVQRIGDFRTGIVGLTLSCSEIKLVDAMTEDNSGPLCDAKGIPYKPSDTRNAQGEPCLGRGEVLIGGVNLTSGYYKMPEQTKASYRGNFFETGDIGEFTPDGNLKIVDRKKNLVKLKGGEYVALEYMETKYSNSEFVDVIAGGILVYAGGDVDRSSAFVQVARKPLENWAKENGITEPFEQLLNNPRARKAVLDDLNRHGKKAGLGDLEKLQNVTLLNGGSPPVNPGPDAWTPSNGGLTATNKINRKTAMNLIGAQRLEKGKVDARTDWLK